MSTEHLEPPVRECPTCGARGTLVSDGWTGEVNHVTCDPTRPDRVNPDRGGCGETVDVDHGGFASERQELQGQLAELRSELEALRSEQDTEEDTDG